MTHVLSRRLLRFAGAFALVVIFGATASVLPRILPWLIPGMLMLARSLFGAVDGETDLTLQRFQQFVRRLLGLSFGGAGVDPMRPPSWGGPADPFAAVRVPTKGRPSGRSSAVAVMEPEDAPVTMAIGTLRSRW